MEAKVRIACAQMEPRIGEKDENLAQSLHFIARAATAGAQLIVLPELANTGYMFATRDEAIAAAEDLVRGPTVAAWTVAARAHGAWIVAGIAEREGDRLYNSAVLIGPDGLAGRYRKAHLWFEENLYFQPGDIGFPVFATPLGHIGIAICYDCWFPEVFRALALAGADIVAVPTNWTTWAAQDDSREAMANLLVMGAAHANGVIIAAANRVGIERGQGFIGRSLIVGHEGWPVAGPASAAGAEILQAEVDLAAARRGRTWNAFNAPLRDRRPALYGIA